MDGVISALVHELQENRYLPADKMKLLLESEYDGSILYNAADSARQSVYGRDVYLRGLIEFTNICRNDCRYCGIRRSNKNASRYRLTEEDILSCCKEGYSLGYRTFVLQGGEDMHFTDSLICSVVRHIKESYPDCAVTLSIGERPYESYKAYRNAGADRYLLRHEAASEKLYRRLHPEEMSLENRKRCLYDLKKLGYQVGSGFMVGAPFQTMEHIIEDLEFLRSLSPDMIGIGPFIPQKDTPMGSYPAGSLRLTLRLISVLRLMFPYALIPSTTALGTIHPEGREMGLKAGANVVMPNLSPVRVREKYSIYDNKICTGEESAQCRACLEKRIESAGCRAVTDIGNVKR